MLTSKMGNDFCVYELRPCYLRDICRNYPTTLHTASPYFLLGRILTGCYWFCILIWVSTYTANLAAFLTVKNAAQPINNLDDIERTSHQVAIIASTSTYASFKTSQYAPHKKIWQRIQADKTFVQNTSQGVQWVRDRKNFAFIWDGPILKHFANQRPCDLRTGK